MNRCSNCRHSEPEVIGEDDVVLICRRYPPTIVIGEDVLTVWPQVEENDVCGEWSSGDPLLRPVQRVAQLLGFRA